MYIVLPVCMRLFFSQMYDLLYHSMMEKHSLNCEDCSVAESGLMLSI